MSGRCGFETVLGEEVRIAGRDDRVDREVPGRLVVGMQPVGQPGIVAQHDVGRDVADREAHRGARRRRRSRARRRSGAGTGCSQRRARARPRAAPPRAIVISEARSAPGSHVPFDPSVQTKRCTSAPASAHLASVAPHPNSMSSGWAPIASTRSGVGRSTRRRHGVGSSCPRAPRDRPRRRRRSPTRGRAPGAPRGRGVRPPRRGGHTIRARTRT